MFCILIHQTQSLQETGVGASLHRRLVSACNSILPGVQKKIMSMEAMACKICDMLLSALLEEVTLARIDVSLVYQCF